VIGYQSALSEGGGELPAADKASSVNPRHPANVAYRLVDELGAEADELSVLPVHQTAQARDIDTHAGVDLRDGGIRDVDARFF
jgi:hypothetical protein